jgi:host factor-I protein
MANETQSQKAPLKREDINVQDMFLEKVKNEKTIVTIDFGKVKMTGIVKAFDQFSITIESYGQEQMVYKQGITYIEIRKPKRFNKPRTGGFRPREAREGSDQSSEGRRPYSPRPRPDFDRKEGGFRPDRQEGRRFDSQRPPSYRSRDDFQRSPEQDQKVDSEQPSDTRYDDSKRKVFRVQKPFPPKKG